MSLDEITGQAMPADPTPTDAADPRPGPDAPPRSAVTGVSDRATELACPDRPDPKSETDIDADTFGSFWIDKTEFALPVAAIREVVNEPETYTPVPLSPPHMRGLFNLRKMIVPVIDLRILLGFPDPTDGRDRKIAIIENGALCIGLLFDDTGDVIKGTGIPRVMFQPNPQGETDVVIKGILKLDDGSRMVQLLDPFELLNMDRLPRVTRHRSEKTASHLGQRLNCITFQLGHTNCAIDLRFVQEITEIPEVQHSQVAYGDTIGNIELRGVTMPIVDFRGLIGTEPPYKFNQDTLRKRKLLVMKLPEGQIGLVVYSIDNIMSFYEGDVLPFANVALPRYDLVAGCLIRDNEEIVILLDHEKLMRDEHLVAAAKSCREIYPSEATAADRAKTTEKSAARTTYILFHVGMPLAFDISRVSEIINRPETLLQPPYALNFVDGILNLRGELITLINPRVIYGLPEIKVPSPKVLIFQTDEEKYGMVVDSVDEIVTANATELFPLPPISEKNRTRTVSEDVLGCLQVSSRGVGSAMVMVLSVTKLIERCMQAGDGLDVTKHH